MIAKVCEETATEPNLTSLSGKKVKSRTTHFSNQQRADNTVRGFWERGQQKKFYLKII